MITIAVILVVLLTTVCKQENHVNYDVTLLWVVGSPESPPGWGVMCVSQVQLFVLQLYAITGLIFINIFILPNG